MRDHVTLKRSPIRLFLLAHSGMPARAVTWRLISIAPLYPSRDSKASTTLASRSLRYTRSEAVGGRLLVVTTDNGANVDFMNADGDIALQYYAFLVSESRNMRRNFSSGSRTVAFPYLVDPTHENAEPVTSIIATRARFLFISR